MNLLELRRRVYDRLDEDVDDPQRWPSSVITEYVNDGIQHLVSRTRIRTETTTITQKPGVLFYKLPDDCVQVLAVYEDEEDEALFLTSWRQMDRGTIPNGILPVPTQFRNRWVRQTGTKATHAFAFSYNEIGLWPVLGPNPGVSSLVTFATEFAGDGQTVSFDLPFAPQGVGVWWNTLRMKQVASNPAGLLQFSLSGSTITVGAAPNAAVTLRVFASAIPTVIVGETPSGVLDGVNTSYTLANTPSSSSAIAIYVNGVRLNNAGDLPVGGISLAAPGAFFVNGSTVLLRVPPASGHTIVADYTTDIGDCFIGEDPVGTIDGVNKEFTLSEIPGDFRELAVWADGVRLFRTSTTPSDFQFQIAGRVLRMGRAPKPGSGFWCDYLRVPNNNSQRFPTGKTYTVVYARDIVSDVEEDSDEPSIPREFHDKLVDYVVARCLLPKARGGRLKRAAESITRYMGAVDQAARFDRNVSITMAPE